MKIRAHARNTATNVAALVETDFLWQNVAGTVTLTALTVPLISLIAALAIALPTPTIAGAVIQPKVTGIAATNIEWLVDVKYWVN